MKKNANREQRILGRKLATRLTAEQLNAIHGGVDTWTTKNPPDKDGGSSDTPIYV